MESDDGETATYRVQDFEENQEFIVVWNAKTSDTSCSCHLFEYNGFLCRHVMIVLQMDGVHKIPSKYILRRWTKSAKSKENMRQVTLVDSRVQRYNDLCQRAFELGDEGSLSQESYNIVFSVLENFLRTCESVNDANLNESEPCSLPNQGLNDLEVFTDSNNPCKNNGKNMTRKEKVNMEQEIMSMVGINCKWPHMGQSGFGERTVDYPFGSHSAIQPMGHINSRISIPDGYYSGPQMIQGVGQLNRNTQGYVNQLNVLGLGQLNSLASVEHGPYLSQPRFHGLGQVYFRPAVAQNSSGLQDSLQESTMDNTQMLHLASEDLHSKNLS